MSQTEGKDQTTRFTKPTHAVLPLVGGPHDGEVVEFFGTGGPSEMRFEYPGDSSRGQYVYVTRGTTATGYRLEFSYHSLPVEGVSDGE